MPSDDLFAGLFADLPTMKIPAVLTSQVQGGSGQSIDGASVSRRSYRSHSENGHRENSEPNGIETNNSDPAGSRVARSCVSQVGTAGSVGTAAKTLAGPTDYVFPSPSLSMRKEEDKWEVPVPALPISPAAVQAGVERELQALKKLGRQGLDALRNAIAITAAKIRNSEALAERQSNGSRCHACDESLNDGHPVVAVLTGKRGAHLYLHADCLEAYSARRAALVDRIMAAAGYGPDHSEVAA